MSALDLFDDDRRDLSDEFKQGMDYSDQFLGDCLNNQPDKAIDKTSSVKSFEDAEQALTDTLAFLATDGTKQMDSNTVALLVKTISDTRTILSAEDLLREDANVAEKPEDVKGGEQKEVSTNSTAGDSTKTTEAVATLSEKPKKKTAAIDESALKELISQLENYFIWFQSVSPLDDEQVKYLARLKKLISGFDSVHELISFCVDFAEQDEGSLYPFTVVFLILIYFSSTPERYLHIFSTKPLDFTVDPVTNTRRYVYDSLINYLKQRRKSRQLS